ncbi:MAG: BatD family protein [Saprospiraceae bacterium]|nr:BatD family protein [Saprospiraceae bacterium]
MYQIWTSLLGLLISAAPVLGQNQAACSLSVSKDKLTTDEVLIVKFEISNNQNGRFTSPDWAGGKWTVIGSSQSSNMTISGGKSISSAIYQFQLMAQDTGWLEIPQAVLKTSSEEIKTEPKKIYVSPGANGMHPQPGRPNSGNYPAENSKKKIKTIRL